MRIETVEISEAVFWALYQGCFMAPDKGRAPSREEMDLAMKRLAIFPLESGQKRYRVGPEELFLNEVRKAEELIRMRWDLNGVDYLLVRPPVLKAIDGSRTFEEVSANLGEVE